MYARVHGGDDGGGGGGGGGLASDGPGTERPERRGRASVPVSVRAQAHPADGVGERPRLPASGCARFVRGGGDGGGGGGGGGGAGGRRV